MFKNNWKKRIMFFLVLSLLVFGFEKAAAYNEKTSTVSRNYSHQQRLISSGFIVGIATGYLSVTHRVGMTSGGYFVAPGTPINFNYSPPPPYFTARGGNFDTPNGAWCANTSSLCISMNRGQLIRNTSGRSNTGWLMWTAVRPSRNITSSNPAVISCAGMNCTAVSGGTATLTANIGRTTGRVWSLASMDREYQSRTNICSRGGILGFNRCSSGTWWSPSDDNFSPGGWNLNSAVSRVNGADGRTMRLSATSMSWDVVVSNDGACGFANGADRYNLNVADVDLCGAGAVANFNENPALFNGAYTWTCLRTAPSGVDVSCLANFPTPQVSITGRPIPFRVRDPLNVRERLRINWDTSYVDSLSITGPGGFSHSENVVPPGLVGHTGQQRRIVPPSPLVPYTYTIIGTNRRGNTATASVTFGSLCTPVAEPWRECEGTCGTGVQRRYLLQADCSRVLDAPRSCELPPCGSGSWKEVNQ